VLESLDTANHIFNRNHIFIGKESQDENHIFCLWIRALVKMRHPLVFPFFATISKQKILNTVINPLHIVSIGKRIYNELFLWQLEFILVH
jgi:hypothetical protein